MLRLIGAMHSRLRPKHRYWGTPAGSRRPHPLSRFAGVGPIEHSGQRRHEGRQVFRLDNGAAVRKQMPRHRRPHHQDCPHHFTPCTRCGMRYVVSKLIRWNRVAPMKKVFGAATNFCTRQVARSCRLSLTRRGSESSVGRATTRGRCAARGIKDIAIPPGAADPMAICVRVRMHLRCSRAEPVDWLQMLKCLPACVDASCGQLRSKWHSRRPSGAATCCSTAATSVLPPVAARDVSSSQFQLSTKGSARNHHSVPWFTGAAANRPGCLLAAHNAQTRAEEVEQVVSLRQPLIGIILSSE